MIGFLVVVCVWIVWCCLDDMVVCSVVLVGGILFMILFVLFYDLIFFVILCVFLLCVGLENGFCLYERFGLVCVIGLLVLISLIVLVIGLFVVLLFVVIIFVLGLFRFVCLLFVDNVVLVF